MPSREYVTPDGTLRGQITITYEISPVSGVPLNEVSVLYSGEDPRLSTLPRDLTLADVRPIFRAWDVANAPPN